MAAELFDVLSKRGPSAAQTLQDALGTSRSALQRALAAERERLLVVGRARATRYAARRAVEGVVTPVPVYEVDEAGAARHALTMHPVEPFGWYVEGHVPDVASGFHETDPGDVGPDPACDLPWFLLDGKPGGFLGRAWVRAHEGQGWPADLARWTGDHVVRYAATYGTDLTGAFVVGPFARELVERRAGGLEAPISPGDEASAYPRWAERAFSEAPWGSSPGGEQPKFAAVVGAGAAVRRVIVKFSPPLDTPGGRRWGDLLVAEHLVHDVLREWGVDACRSRVLDGGGRRFLEVERFDRHGERGRSGLVSLRSLDRSGVAGDLRRWAPVTAALAADGRLAPEDHARVEWLEAFGWLIANTDMHPANLSFRLRGTTIVGLAPVYDMLPMFYAPRHGGELPVGSFSPSSERLDFPASARDAARELWARVAAHPDVSGPFRVLAARQAGTLP